MIEASPVLQRFSMEKNGSKLGDQGRLHLNGSGRRGDGFVYGERDGGGAAGHLQGGNSRNKGKGVGGGQGMCHLFIQQVLMEGLERQRVVAGWARQKRTRSCLDSGSSA